MSVSPASGSELVEPSKVTVSGTGPEVGDAVSRAVGGRFATAVASIRRT